MTYPTRTSTHADQSMPGHGMMITTAVAVLISLCTTLYLAYLSSTTEGYILHDLKQWSHILVIDMYLLLTDALQNFVLIFVKRVL